MKKIIKDTLLLASMMIFVVFGISILWAGVTQEIGLVFKLFGLALIIVASNHVLDSISILPMLQGYILKYVLVTGLVIAYGFIVGWFFVGNWWMAAIYTALVFVPAYFLDLVSIKRDVSFINQKIQARKVQSVKIDQIFR
jgi:ABC-type multidrug transport system permease subunit